jgi:wyosine [tRNA(Phe)-imidazoG37] synthetase (radical SAM superfamily)
VSNIPAKSLFALHDRVWETNRFVYPVVSRRSRGLSIGINLNPDKVCNFDCVYCSVDRTKPSVDRSVDLDVIRRELTHLLTLTQTGEIWKHPPFDRADPSLRRLNDIAFSGDGEPTACLMFQQACELVADVINRLAIMDCKIVLITNATLFHKDRVKQSLAYLDQHRGEIWAKLDAGTEAYFRTIERTTIPLQRVLDNLRDAGQVRPIVIQSLFLKYLDSGPSDAEIDAYIDRLATLKSQGCQIKLVQVYTTARTTADADALPLDQARIDQIASRVRQLDLPADPFYAPE